MQRQQQNNECSFIYLCQVSPVANDQMDDPNVKPETKKKKQAAFLIQITG